MWAPFGLLLQVQVGSLSRANNHIQDEKSGQASVAALNCEMVGGRHDDSLYLYARVYLVEKEENLIFETYMKPQLPVIDYKWQIRDDLVDTKI